MNYNAGVRYVKGRGMHRVIVKVEITYKLKIHGPSYVLPEFWTLSQNFRKAVGLAKSIFGADDQFYMPQFDT